MELALLHQTFGILQLPQRFKHFYSYCAKQIVYKDPFFLSYRLLLVDQSCCPFYADDLETSDHLLLQRKFSWNFW